jgi:hypothetical protein
MLPLPGQVRSNLNHVQLLTGGLVPSTPEPLWGAFQQIIINLLHTFEILR